MPRYCIADVIVELKVPEWALHDNLKPFECAAQDFDICCNAIFEKHADIPTEKAKLIIKTVGTSIYELDGYFNIVNNDENGTISNISMTDDCSFNTVYINPQYNDPNDEKMVQSVKEGIFGALRLLMIAVLTHKQRLIIHSSTIIWKGKGIMFAAESGTGKSTHTNLWKQLYGTLILNGDLAACRMVNSIPWVSGIPWCGTSGEFMNVSVPLKAIVFLQQAEKNTIVKVGTDEAFIRLAARCFQLNLNNKMTNRFLDTVQEVITSTDCYLLNCLPDNDAVELVKNCLDGN